ncbi:hypothetical protein DMUE_6272, partial [Dictyocoela muelleri]
MIIKKTNDNSTKINFRCLNSSCSHYQTTKSVLTGSFFSKFASSPKKVLQVAYYFFTGVIGNHIATFTGLTTRTIVNMKKKFMQMIEEYFQENPIRLGSFGSIVHIDETMMNHTVRSHRGRSPRGQCWALTMVDTSSSPSKGYAEIITNRTAETIMPIILRVVRPGSIIYTDEWRAYNSIANHNEYQHEKITHKYHFVDPITGVHTQNVESFNNKLKLFIKSQRGCLASQRSELIKYFLFIDTFKKK